MDNNSKTRSHDQREVAIYLPIRSSTIIHHNATVNHLSPRAQYQRFFIHARKTFSLLVSHSSCSTFQIFSLNDARSMKEEFQRNLKTRGNKKDLANR